MRTARQLKGKASAVIFGGMMLIWGTALHGQVAPSEISDMAAKATEQRYLPQLSALHDAIAKTDFPFSYHLARYLNAKTGERAALDSNGLEFVDFQNRLILKVSGRYRAEFNSARLTENARAARALGDVIVPLLHLIAKQIPHDMDCDGIGFEMVYNTRFVKRDYEFNGQESLAVVFDRDDAFLFAEATTDAARQEILNRSNIFVNGKEFHLGLSTPFEVNDASYNQAAYRRPARRVAATSGDSSSVTNSGDAAHAGLGAPAKSGDTSTPTFADAIRLQKMFQERIDSVVRNDARGFHLDENAPPSFEVDGSRTILHVTLRNALSFDNQSSSIYKRAAQSFDLFLAQQLRGLLRKLQIDDEFGAMEFSVRDYLGGEKVASETIDYILPLNSVHSFAENRITSQELIDQSSVLVNGVRIGVNLEVAEK